ncbi:GntR family transcriptional regulator [Sabulicella rubraurantiaca]|uniref:GntR family transcriptional regulator n=1 Tax=Sabulicella rubraurantiaca TaxID=2811429 RepID=UPI001A95C676|nr:GntR family transcriptional regulator [Sabulicella rubraurantiaca]
MNPNGSSRAEAVHRALRGQILGAALLPGAMVTEQELADRLGVSRTPVREALQRLRDEGWVEIRARRGIRIRPVSPDDMRDLYAALMALEGAAAAAVARHPSRAEWAERMEAETEAMRTALAQDDLSGWAAADARFHDALLAAAGNSHIARLAAGLADHAHRARVLTVKLRPRPTASLAEHDAVTQALRAGDAEGARAALTRHRERAASEILDALRHLPLPDR